MMKKNILIFIAIVLFSGASFAQTRKHTVQRGETLETIANRYETSVAEITELNPDASRFIYVGMELIIPDSPAASAKSASNDKESSVDSSSAKKKEVENKISVSESSSTRNEQKNHSFSFGIMDTATYGFLPSIEEGPNSTDGYTLAFTIGPTFNFTPSFYTAVQIGWMSKNEFAWIHIPGDNRKYTTSTEHIYIPGEIGYRIAGFLVPHAGVDINYIVKKTLTEGYYGEEQKTKVKVDNNLFFNGRVGIRLTIKGIGLGYDYIFPLNDASGGINAISLVFDFDKT